MHWKNPNKIFRSSLIMIELLFRYGFDLTFNDPHSGNYSIRFFLDLKDDKPRVSHRQIISLN